MISSPILGAEHAREMLSYDSETGIFTWRVDRRRTARARAVYGRSRYLGRCPTAEAGAAYPVAKREFHSGCTL